MSLKKESRKNQILDILNSRNFISTEEIMTHLKVSRATMRRLLIELENEQLIHRFHGGISLYSGVEYNDTKFINKNEKSIIAKYVCENFLTDNQTIFIGSGTTTGYLKNYLSNIKNITIVTNNLLFFPEIIEMNNVQTILTGGIVAKDVPCLIGELFPTEYLTKYLNIDYVFLTTEFVNKKGCSQKSNTAELYFEKAFLNTNSKKILMADHSKIEKNGPFIWADLSSFDALVTDKKTEETLEISKYIKTYFSDEL